MLDTPITVSRVLVMINTEEVFFGLSTELGCGLGLALTYYEDIDQYGGGYS